jgi:hypothetical protein
MGAASALGDARGKGASVQHEHQPTETAVPANAIDTHPTLRFEKGADGVFHWPGESDGSGSNGWPSAGDTATRSSQASVAGRAANDGAASAASATSPPTPAADMDGTRGDRGAHAPSGAGDPVTQSLDGSTTGRALAQCDMGGQDVGSSTETPAPDDTGPATAGRVATDLDPGQAASAGLQAGIPAATLDRSITSPMPYAGPTAEAKSSTVSDPAGQSGVAGLPAGNPQVAHPAVSDPGLTPAVTSPDRGPSSGPPSPATEAQALIRRTRRGSCSTSPTSAATARSPGENPLRSTGKWR